MLGWGLALAALALVVGVWAFRRWRGTHPGWRRPIPGYFADTAFVAPRGYPLSRITYAMQMAETCLIKYGRWNAGQMGAVCLRAHVVVLSAQTSSDLAGRAVRGVPVGHAIQVGAGLTTLAHELAHLCEAVLDKELDEAHSLWERDGIWRAVRAYEEWAIKQGWESA